jgi:sigma-B regulation protein RsbU (phosphoserine phosphatase)
MLAIYFISRQMIKKTTQPLHFFALSAEEVAKGNFSSPLPEVKRNDEVKVLRDSFKAMQNSLSIYVEEINRLLGEKTYTHTQAFDMTKSVEMFNVFQSFKNPEKDIETAIYFHNKASWYKKKVMRNYETVKRYEELRSILQDYDKPQNI